MAAEKPLSVDQALSKARRHAQKGEVRLAEHLYRSVLARFPSNGRALAGLKALDLPPAGQPSAGPSRDQIQGLIALYGQGRLQEALARGQALAGQFPASAILQNVLGVISAGLGRLDEAVQCYTRALQLMPGYPEALNNLGNALGSLGKPGEAV
jgi:tetratricopeptide (TPR) repeat protein